MLDVRLVEARPVTGGLLFTVEGGGAVRGTAMPDKRAHKSKPKRRR